MTLAKYREESKPLLPSLKIIEKHELYIYLMALFMYSYLNENLPTYILLIQGQTKKREIFIKSRGAQICIYRLPNVSIKFF